MQRIGKEFVNQSVYKYPQTKRLLEWLTKDGYFKLRMHKSIELDKVYDDKWKVDKGFGLRAAQNINANEEIFLVSTENCITGLELIDCDRIKAFEINKTVSMIASKYYEKNLPQLYYTQNILKIICQIFAHSSGDQMKMYPFANTLLEHYNNQTTTKNPLFWDKNAIKGIYSSNLASIISSTQSQFVSMNEDLLQNRMFGFNLSKFIEMMSVVRSRNLNFCPEQPKFFDINSVVIMSPVVDWINHSFDPNCKLTGAYYQHETESFVVVKAAKDIKQGEELTVNYGNMNNMDYLMRYGFVNQSNPHNELSLTLNFDDYLEYTSQLFDFKQKIFKTQEDFSLDRFILFENRINKNLLRSLRIYFLKNEDLLTNPEIASYRYKDFDKQISTENELIICKFMIETLKKELEKYQKARINTLDMNQLMHPNKKDQIINLDSHEDLIYVQNQNYRNMLHICIDEQTNIQKNIKFFEKQLQNLV
ncbi:SET domain protein (macronuclear) [Tetrahymena thermophila SB210]|uniref:SET domain protein n=1 Tax=Tetrahymena thermophila (strain SB210) TaxID=312017 RepID=Q23DX7_TETTS|nr:SET domain protein [Tetrahymena thermophila SB210]EAR94810.2 SET domain protein [Tetrahymena thermophila SB210]|eukprot:XP_001015055.2 SET domain protein [Tetrahymena thermophila SB210]